MKRFLQKLELLLFPRNAVCVGCGDKRGFEGEWLCPRCREKAAQRWVGAFYDEKLDGAAAAYRYEGPAGSVVRHMKYRGVSVLKDMMAEDMLRALRHIEPVGIETVTAVPMHPKRIRERGFNQSELLAKEIAARLEVPFDDCLVRTRNTVQQARLEGKARRQNLKGAIEAKTTVAGKWVLLVDDVYTTGTTAHECAKALRKAGARHVSYLAYTRGSGKEKT